MLVIIAKIVLVMSLIGIISLIISKRSILKNLPEEEISLDFSFIHNPVKKAILGIKKNKRKGKTKEEIVLTDGYWKKIRED